MSDPDLTPTEEQVRRLLADARHDEPMPADVADRLDGVLADLQGEARRAPAPVELAARRRRRIARNVLVAAAAVVVVGVGISQVDLSGSDDSASSDSGSTAADAPQPSSAREDAGGDSGPLKLAGRPLVLHSDDFDQRVKLLRTADALNSLAATLPEGYSGKLRDFADEDLAFAARIWCNDPAWGTGRRIAVRYDGKRGVLVLRPPSRGSRVADLYLCGDATPTRSTTVPAG